MIEDTKNKGILLACYVENITTRKDKTVKLTIGSQELTPEKAGDLFSLMGKIAAMYITEKEVIPQAEIDKVDSLDAEFGGKTQSQRLRGVFFKLFEVHPEGFKSFDNYYHHKMDELINHYKAKL